MPFYSIIIPTYNCEQTICRCLQSVFDQKFDDFELIVVDGSSTDKTIALVNDIVANNRSVPHQIISEKDHGIYDAMNKGANLAKGEWLYFMGSDDEFVNNDVLPAVSKHIVQNPGLDFFYGNVLLRSTGERYAGRFDTRRLMVVNICHQALFVSKETFMELGPFNTRYTLWADWDFNLKVFFHKKQVSFANHDIAYYNDSGRSAGSSDMIFGQRLQEIKKEYFSNPVNRFKSRLHHGRKKIIRWITSESVSH